MHSFLPNAKLHLLSKAGWLLGLFALVLLPAATYAQEVRGKGSQGGTTTPQQVGTQTITGTVIDEETGEPLIGVSVSVVGRVTGTITDANGNYTIRVDAAGPVKLRFSYVGFAIQEIDATPGAPAKISLKSQSVMANEVVVSASRVSESVLKAPVSVEKMDQLAVQNTPAANFYEGLASYKAVDMTTVGLGFKAINTRGFNSQFNTRFVQRIDGMDNQAPGLNISFGNIVGANDLDVESVELIPGAASALYGPNALNGIMNITTKDPFRYQGISAQVKVGVNHIDRTDRGTSPYYDLQLRYAKAFFNDRLAFKLNAGYLVGQDWRAVSTDNVNTSASSQPNAPDLLHTYGDEITSSVGTVTSSLANLFSAFPAGSTIPANTFFAGQPALVAPGRVSRTGYNDVDLANTEVRSIRANGGLHYRVTDNLELSYNFNFGIGTSMFMAADRYTLQDFAFQQHKLEAKADEWQFRVFTTIENAGQTYNSRFLGYNINRSWVRPATDIAGTGPTVLELNPSLASNVAAGLADRTWFERFANAYIGALGGAGIAGNDLAVARAFADRGRLQVGTSAFDDAKKSISKVSDLNRGAAIIDFTQMYHAEGQYDFKKLITNPNHNLIVGGNYRIYLLGSAGSIFQDGPGTSGRITNWEAGGFAQYSLKMIEERLRLTLSVRGDKNQNFDLQFSPRAGVAFDIAQNHTLRASVQTGFRIPSLQEQFIDLLIGNAKLVGGLEGTRAQYQLENNVYTFNSVSAFGAAATTFIGQQVAAGVSQSTAALLFANNPANVAILQRYNFSKLKPESIQSLEVGYKGLFGDNLYVDLSYYYSRYFDFIGSVVLVRPNNLLSGPNAALAPLDILQNNFGAYQSYANAQDIVNSQGFSAGAEYTLGKNYKINANYSFAELRSGSSDPLIPAFNTPKHKTNVSFSNRSVVKNLGFSVAWRWSDTYQWASTFDPSSLNPTTPRFVPAFNLIDAQITYKMPKIKSSFKFGGSNILNNRHIEIWGGPVVGSLYYVSWTFDELMN